MKKKVLIAIAALVALLLVVVGLQPASFHVERSVLVKAPRETVMAQVNDFHLWRAWSPWEKLDPNLKRSYGGAAAGVGATYAWIGNKQVGEGRMTIEESAPERVVIKLEFLKPFAATNQATFTFATVSEGTQVTWAMDGVNDFVGKAFSLVMNMDKMIGADFERGLTALKSAAEASPASPNVAAAR